MKKKLMKKIKIKKKEIRNRMFLIIGDSQGNVKIIDLMGYIKKNN